MLLLPQPTGWRQWKKTMRMRWLRAARCKIFLRDLKHFFFYSWCASLELLTTPDHAKTNNSMSRWCRYSMMTLPGNCLKMSPHILSSSFWDLSLSLKEMNFWSIKLFGCMWDERYNSLFEEGQNCSFEQVFYITGCSFIITTETPSKVLHQGLVRCCLSSRLPETFPASPDLPPPAILTWVVSC